MYGDILTLALIVYSEILLNSFINISHTSNLDFYIY